jgi:hypothetical protein
MRKSEFGQIGLLPDTYLTINALDAQYGPDSAEFGRQIENKIAGALSPLVKSILSQSGNDNVLYLIQVLASKIESAQYSHYLRAGRNHVEIKHGLGLEGNMFFKTAFDIVLGRGMYHVLVQENSICVVFRISSA